MPPPSHCWPLHKRPYPSRRSSCSSGSPRTGLSTRELRYPNFFYYSTFGLVFLLVGTGILAPLDASSVIWALLAIVMAYFSYRVGWVSLSLQCTILLVAASVASGLLMTGLVAFTGDPADGWAVVTPAQGVVAAATVACLFIPVAQHSERWGTLSGLPQLIVLGLSVWSVGALFIAISGPPVAGIGGTEPSLAALAAALAAVRTAVLAAAAVTLARGSLAGLPGIRSRRHKTVHRGLPQRRAHRIVRCARVRRRRVVADRAFVEAPGGMSGFSSFDDVGRPVHLEYC